VVEKSYFRTLFPVVKTFLTAYKSYFKQIARLSSPIIIGQIGIVLMGVADVVMIGKTNATNLAAAGLANSIFFLVSIIGIGTLMAVSSLVAQAKGAGHTNQCAWLFRGALLGATLLSGIIGFILFMAASHFYLFRQQEDVAQLAEQFLHLLNLGTLPLLLFVAAKQFSDGLSFTKPSAYITISALLLNIVLNWLLIYGNMGFPAMGLNGAGLATLIARVSMALCMIGYVIWHKQYRHFIHVKENISPFQSLRDIFRVGLPSGLQYFFEISAFSVAGIMIGWIGKNEQAAHHIALNVASVTYMIATGISAAGSILVGDALGRKNKADIIRSGKAALISGALFMGSCAVILAVFGRTIIRLYVNDHEVALFASSLLLIAAVFQLSDGIQCVSLGILRGIEDTKIPTLITIVAYWVVGVPVGYLLAFSYNMSLYGIWIGLLLALTCSAVLQSRRFILLSKRMDVFKIMHRESTPHP
jgi:MATE family multidrug resistance protein